jgi:predicted nuclease with TOPRIM domain
MPSHLSYIPLSSFRQRDATNFLKTRVAELNNQRAEANKRLESANTEYANLEHQVEKLKDDLIERERKALQLLVDSMHLDDWTVLSMLHGIDLLTEMRNNDRQMGLFNNLAAGDNWVNQLGTQSSLARQCDNRIAALNGE